MSGQYFLDQLCLRWTWGSIDPEIIATRSSDVLADWKTINRGDADGAVQLLRHRDFHRGNFMPSADELEAAVAAHRRSQPSAVSVSANSGGFVHHDPVECRRDSAGRALAMRRSQWATRIAQFGSVDAVLEAYHTDRLHAPPVPTGIAARAHAHRTGERDL